MEDDPGGTGEDARAQMLVVAPGCRIDREELRWRFLPSGGPGGQHANRASTRVELRFDVAGSPSLTEAQRLCLTERVGPELRITCGEERSQARNRAIALKRLLARLREGLEPVKVRRPTSAPRGATEARIEDKKRRGSLKRSRSWQPED